MDDSTRPVGHHRLAVRQPSGRVHKGQQRHRVQLQVGRHPDIRHRNANIQPPVGQGVLHRQQEVALGLVRVGVPHGRVIRVPHLLGVCQLGEIRRNPVGFQRRRRLLERVDVLDFFDLRVLLLEVFQRLLIGHRVVIDLEVVPLHVVLFRLGQPLEQLVEPLLGQHLGIQRRLDHLAEMVFHPHAVLDGLDGVLPVFDAVVKGVHLLGGLGRINGRDQQR